MIKVKECDICNKSGDIHFRVKSINYENEFSAVKNAGLLFLKKSNIRMEELEKYN